MSIFHKKEGSSHLHFDPDKEEPAVRKSICTGEMTVGFLLRGSKHFRDVQVVHSQAEVDAFCRAIGADPSTIKTIY